MKNYHMVVQNKLCASYYSNHGSTARFRYILRSLGINSPTKNCAFSCKQDDITSAIYCQKGQGTSSSYWNSIKKHRNCPIEHKELTTAYPRTHLMTKLLEYHKNAKHSIDFLRGEDTWANAWEGELEWAWARQQSLATIASVTVSQLHVHGEWP